MAEGSNVVPTIISIKKSLAIAVATADRVVAYDTTDHRPQGSRSLPQKQLS